MRQLVYALRFRGEATPVGIDGNVLRIAMRAPGCTLASRIDPDGLAATLQPTVGDEATLASEMTVTGESTFQEAGAIDFGPASHCLQFSTVGNGHLTVAAADDRRHGAAIWRVDGGAGQFEGASGFIASTFVLGDAGEVTSHHLGVLFVRTHPPDRRVRGRSNP